jgi:hypothetical protein
VGPDAQGVEQFQGRLLAENAHQRSFRTPGGGGRTLLQAAEEGIEFPAVVRAAAQLLPGPG